jgi:uncharacterized protein (TIGR03435 family)
MIEDGKLKLKLAMNERGGGVSIGNGLITGTNTSVASLAFALSNVLKCTVLDKTGVTGDYDFALKWAPADESELLDSGPSIFTALKEQHGVRLVSTRVPVDIVVVNHVERPSPN